jgi:diphosphomevalonate decarboxylase
MSALALCLTSIQEELEGKPFPQDVFFNRASYLARLGSGSACRSVYSGYTIWGFHPLIQGSSDDRAIPVPVTIHPVFREMGDAILVVSSKEKSVSSRAGHGLMEGHPYAPARYSRAAANALAMTRALAAGDPENFVRITEQEALDLHALMMSSEQSYLLLEPATLSVIAAVRRFRSSTGIPLCFTLDAGPNVHLIYPISQRETVLQWVREELSVFCENGRFIDDRIGNGPEKLVG